MPFGMHRTIQMYMTASGNINHQRFIQTTSSKVRYRPRLRTIWSWTRIIRPFVRSKKRRTRFYYVRFPFIRPINFYSAHNLGSRGGTWTPNLFLVREAIYQLILRDFNLLHCITNDFIISFSISSSCSKTFLTNTTKSVSCSNSASLTRNTTISELL